MAKPWMTAMAVLPMLACHSASFIRSGTSTALDSAARAKESSWISTAPEVLFYDLDAAAELYTFQYEELSLVFTLQGLANRRSNNIAMGADGPALLLNAAFMNFDWPGADVYWKDLLQQEGRVHFTNVSNLSLCGLVETVKGRVPEVFKGAVLYENAMPSGHGYTLPMALTIAAQETLLPVTEDLRAKHTCLTSINVEYDLRIEAHPNMTNRSTAWRWAIKELLPKSSKDRIFNLYHFDPRYKSDPQSNATLGNLDLAIQNNAFVMDLNPDEREDLQFMESIFAEMNDLFDAYGWAHNEHEWTRTVSVWGGVVFCSFSAPNLSFWAILALPPDAPSGRARKLPTGDSGKILNRSKYYLTFETNEGDTPRIIVSAFGSSWASPLRGSIPVAWAVDPVLSERFPALMDYFAKTSTANDSFIGGVAGAGYVYLGALNDAQLHRYASRTGQLYERYGPTVVDTYGQANMTVITKYSKFASLNGTAPAAFVTQPLWSHSSYSQDAWRCPALNLYDQVDGTPIICTANDPNLFYRNRGLSPGHPGRDLADRIRNVSERYEPPFFITVYGGLNWQPGSTGGKTEFWTLLHSTMSYLGEQFEAIGASEMARLAKEACHPAEPTNKTKTCGVAVAQRHCSPNEKPWQNATEAVCRELGCCWHQGGIDPMGHWCIHPEANIPTCLKPRIRE